MKQVNGKTTCLPTAVGSLGEKSATNYDLVKAYYSLTMVDEAQNLGGYQNHRKTKFRSWKLVWVSRRIVHPGIAITSYFAERFQNQNYLNHTTYILHRAIFFFRRTTSLAIDL